jgi:hypothetical protein
MRSIRTLLHPRPAAALLALAVVFAGWYSPARAQEFNPNTAQKTQQTPAGRTVWHHVGRLFVNASGGFVWAGYLVHIDPIDSSLFDGSPSESTAYFTFSTDQAQLTPLPNNNDVALDLVSAGTFSVYYNATPSANWSDPASFSRGKLIARFNRKESLVQLSPIAFHDLSETLGWSSNFVFGGQTYNFNRITPNGVTFTQFVSTAQQFDGPANYPVTFSGAGTASAVGTP